MKKYWFYNKAALRTTIIYMVVSAAWILFSDKILLTNPETTLFISTVKGWIYTIVVGIFIYVAIARELNNLNNAKQIIIKEKEKYQSLFSNMINGFAYHQIITDNNNIPINYKFLEINSAFEEMTGLKRQEIIGKNVTDVISGVKYESANWIGKYGKVALSGKGSFFEDYSVSLKKWFNISAYSPQPGYFVTIFEDITERKLIEKKLLELDKLKDNFLSITTHELRTPLTPIKSQVQLLLEGDYGKLNSEQERAIKMISRNEENLNRLTSDLMDISKIKSNKFTLILEKIELNEIINNIIKDLKSLAKEKNIIISFLPLIGIPKINADKLRIVQIMNNLISNALKFTPENGQINIELKNSDNNIVISIKDTGIGLATENLSKIFTPFSQVQNDLNRKYRGTGLGLSITKGIVEAHGGKIWAESPGEGQGSSFIFNLPIN